MCNPVAVQLVGVAITIAGTVASSVAAQQQAKNAQKAARYNAEVRNQQAETVLEQGRLAASERRRQVRVVLGKQRASLAASGVALSEGNALDIQLQTLQFGALDAATIEHNAALRANALRNSAEIELFKGDAAHATATGQAIATGISGAGSAVSSLASIDFGATGGESFFDFNSDPLAPQEFDLPPDNTNFAGVA